MSAQQHKEKSASFFCGYCQKLICDDCRQIAEEYQELYENQKQTLFEYEQRVKRAEEEAARQKRRADDYEQIMKLGQNAMMIAWMGSLSSDELRRSVEMSKQAKTEAGE